MGKRGGRRSGQGGKHSALPATAPWRGEPQRGALPAMARKIVRRAHGRLPPFHGKTFRRHKRIFVNSFAARFS